MKGGAFPGETYNPSSAGSTHTDVCPHSMLESQPKGGQERAPWTWGQTAVRSPGMRQHQRRKPLS